MSESPLNERVSEAMPSKFAISSLDCYDFPSSTCQQGRRMCSVLTCLGSLVLLHLICNKMLKGSLPWYLNMIWRNCTAEIALPRNICFSLWSVCF